MYRITDAQVDYILNDIRRNGVEMEDLQYNLLDHICCIIEQELEADGDFERFYQRTVKQFYKHKLSEIEEETINLLTFKNFYQMKKFMLVSGTFAAAAFIVGSFFKIMYWPGAGVLLVLGFFSFAFMFLPLLFLLKTKETGSQRDKIILGAATVMGITYTMSMLFQVQHWPGARIIWLSTLAITFFIVLPLFFFSGIRKPETKVNTIVTSVMLIGFLGVQFTLTALRPSAEMQARVYTYLQSEQLLQRAQLNEPNNDKQVASIQNTCKRLKELIMQQDMGMEFIPVDFESKGMRIKEKNISGLISEGEGQQLLTSLKQQVNAFNATNSNKIPVEHSVLQPGFANKAFCGDLFVLNNITQLQLFLTSNRGNSNTAMR